MSEPSPSPSPSPSLGSLIHVLAVDDCLIDRKIVEKLLKTAKFKVTTVESGKKAIEVLGLNEENVETPLNEHNIDIIFTDYCMPEMNGYDLLKAVKEHSHLKSIPVVIMSSEHDPQRISRCLATGAEEFMRKPLKLRDVQRLRSYVRPITPITITGTKRKVPLDLIPENNGSERRPRIAGVAVA
ncbi:Signal transduction response regulator [Macleaya cordata]|uniref:Signal transduction response regulator n=1 Tax=Macleaya cordata TaxID=56857 RepID=A0A200QM94_MACCD|nr:Signal transduction response regulator [Macleaya cordata]